MRTGWCVSVYQHNRRNHHQYESMQREDPAMSQVKIQLPTPLRPYCQGCHTVEVQAHTVREAITALGTLHESLLERLLTPERELRPFVVIFLGKKNIRALQGMETPVSDRDTLTIVPAIAGG
jgi:molybdopterin converting factor small subunit